MTIKMLPVQSSFLLNVIFKFLRENTELGETLGQNANTTAIPLRGLLPFPELILAVHTK